MFAKLDARISAGRKKPEPAPAAPAATPEGGEPPKPEAGAAPAAQPAAPQGPKALREQYEKTQGELKATKGQIAEMERKLAEAERRGKDTTALSERLATMEKERAELQGELRALRQESSPEFKEKWDKPFNVAAEYAKRDIEALTVYDENDNPVRQANWDDFAQLYRMPKGKAIGLAKQMFGADQAGIVISHITDLQRLEFNKNQALQEERANFSKREQEQAARQAQEREAVQRMWTEVNKDISEKHPEWYQPDPQDEEGNALLDEGYKLVDSALSNRNAMTLQQKVVLDANIRHRAAAFTRAQHQLTRARDRIAELEAIVAGKKASEPGDVHHPAGEPGPAEKSWRDDLKASLS